MPKSALLFILVLVQATILTAQQRDGWKLTPVDVLNTAGDEYAPRMGEEGLIYSRSPITGDSNVDMRTELMYSAFRQNGLQTGRLFSDELSSPLHESSACLGPNEDYVVFSRNSPSKRNATNYLYLSRTGVHDFQDPEQLPFNDPRFNTTHPTLDNSGKRLLFSSDRPGGFGGFDLYYAEYKDGVWSKPINLGKEINSRSDEIFPFWSDNNQITFSSNRPGGLGGLDLYLLDASEPVWKGVQHIGKPFSSSGDDHGLTWSAKHRKGYLSSSREGGKGGDDIYSFTFSEASPISWLKPKPFTEKLVIRNSMGNVVAQLDEASRWTGALATFPDISGADRQELAQRLCGEFIEGVDRAADTISMNQIRLEVRRADFNQPVLKVNLRKPEERHDAVGFRTNIEGGVCLPTPKRKEAWIIDKAGFAPQSIELDASVPYVSVDLYADYPVDSIVLRKTFETNRRISASLSDMVLNSILAARVDTSYQLSRVEVNLLSTQTAKSARSEADKLASLITKTLPTHPSVEVKSVGLSVFSDEGKRALTKTVSQAEARVEYALILRRVPSADKGLGLNID